MKLRIGTRGSALALEQTRTVVHLLQDLIPELETEICVIRTEGDRRTDMPLSEIGGKGVFVKEIEAALVSGEIDLAVHSLKDVPAQVADGLVIGAVLSRVDPRDVVVSRDGGRLADLPGGAVVATGSARRTIQIRHLRDDLVVAPIRGNVDTRLRKLAEGRCDALVLAAAGLQRLGLLERATEFLETDVMVPAAGQGVLALEVRAEDRLLDIVARLDDPPTRHAITAERAFLGRLGAGCQLPVGAYARVAERTLVIDGVLGDEDGHLARARVEGTVDQAGEIGIRLADTLLSRTKAAVGQWSGLQPADDELKAVAPHGGSKPNGLIPQRKV